MFRQRLIFTSSIATTSITSKRCQRVATSIIIAPRRPTRAFGFLPPLCTQNIVGASVAIFSAAVANRAKRIVFCSSMARYGALKPPFREDQKPKPQDPYGIGKLAAEDILRNLCTAHGVEYVIAVPHNIIGPRQKWDDPFRNVASIMINLMLQGASPSSTGQASRSGAFRSSTIVSTA